MPKVFMNGICLEMIERLVRGRRSLISRKENDTEILSKNFLLCDMIGIGRAEWTEGRRIYYGDIVS